MISIEGKNWNDIVIKDADGKRIRGITSFNIHMTYESAAPKVDLELYIKEIKINGEVNFIMQDPITGEMKNIDSVSFENGDKFVANRFESLKENMYKKE